MKIKKSFTLLYKYWEFWIFIYLNTMFFIGNNRDILWETEEIKRWKTEKMKNLKLIQMVLH